MLRLVHSGKIVKGKNTLEWTDDPVNVKSPNWLNPVEFAYTISVQSNLIINPITLLQEYHIGANLPLTLSITESGLPIQGWNAIAEVITPSGRRYFQELHENPETKIHNGNFIHTDDPGFYTIRYTANGRSLSNSGLVKREIMRSFYVSGKEPLFPRPKVTNLRKPIRYLYLIFLLILILLVINLFL